MEHQVVVFALGPERYGVPISSVYEIIRRQPITAIPNAPAFVRGIINLRGRIIPVVDLRERFGLVPMSGADAGRIVVCEAGGSRVGLIVDGVSEVLMVPGDAIDAEPEVARGPGGTFVGGIAKIREDMILLLELDLLFEAAAVTEMCAA